MKRIYYRESISFNKEIELKQEDSHHLSNVLRMKADDEIYIFNEKNGEWLCQIINFRKKNLILLPTKLIRQPEETIENISLAFSIIKNDSLHTMIRSATEIGVSHLYPIISDRCVNRNLNLKKIEAYAKEASQQCERLDIPKILPITTFNNFIEKKPYTGELFVAIERGESKYKNFHSKNPCFLIGPEGGWSKKEIDVLNEREEIKKLSLGKNILRAETAAISCMAISKLIK